MAKSGFHSSVLTLPELLLALARERASGKTVAFTNGCFDLLHVGHAMSLEFARGQADILVVGVNDDESVRRLKGRGRPLIPLAERMLHLSYYRSVDYVTSFGEDTAVRLVEVIRPDVYIKGSDYNIAETPEGLTMLAQGGKVVAAPYKPGYSTTRIIAEAKRKGEPS